MQDRRMRQAIFPEVSLPLSSAVQPPRIWKVSSNVDQKYNTNPMAQQAVDLGLKHSRAAKLNDGNERLQDSLCRQE